MPLAGVRPEDLVLVDKRGRQFVALVDAVEPRRITFRPLDRRITYREATSHEVLGHWRKRALGRPGPRPRMSAEAATDGSAVAAGP